MQRLNEALLELIKAGIDNPILAVNNLIAATLQQTNGNSFLSYDHFFCRFPSLHSKATFYSMGATNFYGVCLTYFEPDNSNTNGIICETCDEIFHKSCTIQNFYLPFFTDDEDALFSLFTNLHLINFEDYGQSIWLPPFKCSTRNELKQLLKNYMMGLDNDKCNYIEFDIDAMVDKVHFYSKIQLMAIIEQYHQFWNFIKTNNLEGYIPYINYKNNPIYLSQNEWDNYVLLVKAAAAKLMAVMRNAQPNG